MPKLSIPSKAGFGRYAMIAFRHRAALRLPAYVKESTLANIAALLRTNSEKSQDDDKLLDLYWNRNELKKEFADLRREKFRLQDRLKQQEGATARVQQKLEHLEELLVDQEWARSALTFYQLRGLGLRCQRKLACFAEQLKQQRERRQQDQVMGQWRQSLERDIQIVESEIRRARDSRAQLEEQLVARKQSLDDMNGVSRLFRARSTNSEIDTLAERIEERRAEENRLLVKLGGIRSREAPETAGLDVTSKRSINFMILAFAQQLYVMFNDDELVCLVKEACEKSAGSVKYGSDADCDAILRRVKRSAEAMEQTGDFAEELQRRAKLVGERALFHDNADAVPAAGSVATLFRFGASGSVSEGELELLRDNYWSIGSVLSR